MPIIEGRKPTAEEEQAFSEACARQREGEKYEPREHVRNGKMQKLGAGLTPERVKQFLAKGKNLPRANYQCSDCQDSGFRTQTDKAGIMYGIRCVCRNREIERFQAKKKGGAEAPPAHFLPD